MPLFLSDEIGVWPHCSKVSRKQVCVCVPTHGSVFCVVPLVNDLEKD